MNTLWVLAVNKDFRAWSEEKANNYEDAHWNCDCGLHALVLPIRRRDGSDCFLSYSYQCLSPQGLWMKFTRRSNIKEMSEESPSSRDIPFFYTYLFVLCMCVNMCANACMRVMCAFRDMHVEVGGQLLRTSFPFTMCVPGLSSDPWA